MKNQYRGRLAPSPTGYLHIGHAFTFLTAEWRAKLAQGVLILRIEDLDPARSKQAFATAMVEDLEWLNINWDEGYATSSAKSDYCQSQRMWHYAQAFARLRELGLVYPCSCSRQDVLNALSAPHDPHDEPLYPGTCREKQLGRTNNEFGLPPRVNWRFRVPESKTVTFMDRRCGIQSFVAGKDFGDFVVWRHDQLPSYQLAVTVDDAAMRITEVVRGSDLLLSTARQLLLYEALELESPQFYHCPVLCHEGKRLAKRDQSMTIRSLKQNGLSASDLRAGWQQSLQHADGDLHAADFVSAFCR